MARSLSVWQAVEWNSGRVDGSLRAGSPEKMANVTLSRFGEHLFLHSGSFCDMAEMPQRMPSDKTMILQCLMPCFGEAYEAQGKRYISG